MRIFALVHIAALATLSLVVRRSVREAALGFTFVVAPPGLRGSAVYAAKTITIRP